MTALVHPEARDAAICRAILAEGSRTFSVAGALLPGATRRSVAAFYAFCRVADDAVDESDDPGRAVARLHRTLDRVFDGVPNDDAMERELARVVDVQRLPREVFDALLEGFAWDAAGRRYETLDELLAYCARVASTVGAVMTLLLGRREADTLARACDLGLAMQLTNIARDVGEDARRGRLYLPRQQMWSEGLDPDAWLASPEFSPELGRVISDLLAYADALYESAAPGVSHLPARVRPAIRGASRLYREIGHRLRTDGLDSVSKRTIVPMRRKLWLLAGAAFRPSPRFGIGRPPAPSTAFLVDACA